MTTHGYRKRKITPNVPLTALSRSIQPPASDPEEEDDALMETIPDHQNVMGLFSSTSPLTGSTSTTQFSFTDDDPPPIRATSTSVAWKPSHRLTQWTKQTSILESDSNVPSGLSASESDTPWGGPVVSGTEAEMEEVHPLQPSTTPLSKLPSAPISVMPEKKWRNWWVRLIWTLIMVTLFFFILLAGHVWVVLLVIAIQLAVFKEVIQIAHVPTKEKKLPWFRLINWYFLVATNYFLYGESVLQHFYRHIPPVLLPLATHHRFISFTLYITGLIFFVLNLKKGYYKFQFSQFGWTHMALLLVVFQSHAILNNIFEGLIWFFLPCSLVITNDVFAYVCGFFWGKTPLIKLSPKKTWEGFLGGALCTLIFGFLASHVLIKIPYFICPVADLGTNYWSGIKCTVNPVFLPKVYHIPSSLSFLLGKTVRIAPLQLHALVFSIFASSIAPFGGFFASGVKRAFKIKDFGDTIPGHGGITDRFDCQFIMGTFSFIYVTSFIGRLGAGDVLQRIMQLSYDEQLIVYRQLGELLRDSTHFM